MSLTEQERTIKDLEIAFGFGLDKNHIVLDLGCGEGKHSVELSRRGQRKVIGIDIDQSELDKAKSAKGDLNLVRANWYLLPLTDSQFDFALLFNSGIANSPPKEILVLLREIQRVLRTKGKVIFNVENGDEVIKQHTNPENGQTVIKEKDYPYFDEGKKIVVRLITWIDLERQIQYAKHEVIDNGIVTNSIDDPPTRFYTTQQYREILSAVGLNLLQVISTPPEDRVFAAGFTSFILAGR